MSSADEIRGRKVDIEQYRKTYEADEHWILRKVSLRDFTRVFVYLHF